MSNKNGTQGQSRIATGPKEIALQTVFERNIHISKKWQNDYFGFDLNAGSGHNENASIGNLGIHGVPGSPLVFLDRIKEKNAINYKAYFVDINEKACNRLRNEPLVLNNPNVFVVCEDNKEFARRIPEIIRKWKYALNSVLGSIICDPNGFKDIPIKELVYLSRVCPYIDQVININTMIIKRCRGVEKSRGAFGKETWYRPDQIIKMIKKDYWYIQNPVGGTQQFSLFIGTNYEFKYGIKGFLNVAKPDGQELLHYLSFSEGERKAS